MPSLSEQVRSASDAIDRNIAVLSSDRGFLSQNVLQYLRDLVEALIVWSHTGDPTLRFNYTSQFDGARTFAKSQAKYRPLTRFHAMLQVSVSHYTLDGDPSERLMLKYYEYLLRTREVAATHLGVAILQHLEDFPLQVDPVLREYYEKIAAQIDQPALVSPSGPRRDRYYILSSRPFYANRKIYYEVTFSPAHNRTSKFDRIIGFTDIDVTEFYAANLELEATAIEIHGQDMPINLVRSWEVSIRPCEFNNFARIFGHHTTIQSGQTEYRNLMLYLTRTKFNLLDLIDMSDVSFNQIKTWATDGIRRAPEIFTVLESARRNCARRGPGRANHSPSPSEDEEHVDPESVRDGSERLAVQPLPHLEIKALRYDALLYLPTRPYAQLLRPRYCPGLHWSRPRTPGQTGHEQRRAAWHHLHA